MRKILYVIHDRAGARVALDAVKDTLREAGTEGSGGDDAAGEVSFFRARMANEVLKAHNAKVRLADRSKPVMTSAIFGREHALTAGNMDQPILGRRSETGDQKSTGYADR